MLSAVSTQLSQHDSKRRDLHEILVRRSVCHGEFELASGGKSNVFFDVKMTLLDPAGINLAADLVLEILENDPVDAVGGLIIGACPLVSALSVKSFQRRRAPKSFFYVRKEPKARGTKKLIEGNLESGSKVVIVDDVTTEGNSALSAVKAVRDLGCHVSKVVTVVDRCQGAEKNFLREGIQLISLFKISDFPV